MIEWWNDVHVKSIEDLSTCHFTSSHLPDWLRKSHRAIAEVPNFCGYTSAALG